jgi:hypothetical protein
LNVRAASGRSTNVVLDVQTEMVVSALSKRLIGAVLFVAANAVED